MPLSRSLTVRYSQNGRPANVTYNVKYRVGLPKRTTARGSGSDSGSDRRVLWFADSANALPTEVERAAENLAKSGKPFGGFSPAASAPGSRRESMPMMNAPRPYPEPQQQQPQQQQQQQGTHTPPQQDRRQTPRLTDADARYGGQQRHHSVSEYDGARAHSASNAQGFYQNQRFAPRPNDADQMAQAKRRMAAQRERELRNYHQEQQYHRSKDSESGQQ
jgi:hypothetical protein